MAIGDHMLSMELRSRERDALLAGRIAALTRVREQLARERLDHDDVAAVWLRAFAGKLLFRLGRRREALGMAAAAVDRCPPRGRRELRQLLEACGAEDPLGVGWLDREPIMRFDEHISDAIHRHVRSALRSVRAGTTCHDELAELAVPDGPDHAFDRALVELARSLCARRRQQGRLASTHLRRAVVAATAGEADDDLVPEIGRRLAHAERPGSEAGAGALIIDTEVHELRDGPHRVSFGSRHVLRRLLYAFVAAPRRCLSRDEIAASLWGCSFDPIRRASSVKSSILRLRGLLDGTRAVVVSEPDGYCLRLPASTIVIAPQPYQVPWSGVPIAVS